MIKKKPMKPNKEDQIEEKEWAEEETEVSPFAHEYEDDEDEIEEEVEIEEKNGSFKKIITILGIVIAAGVLIFGTISMLNHKNQNKVAQNTSQSQTEQVDKTTAGKIKETDNKALQEKLNQKVAESQININYQSHATFDQNGKATQFMVRNIENNKHPIEFIIYNNKNKVIYHSSPIKQGFQVDTIQLKKPLKKGNYNYTISIGYVDENKQKEKYTEAKVVNKFPLSIEVQ